MSCRLEIKKSVEKSINTKLPYRDAIYPLASAKIIANYLNKLWDSKIAVPIQYLKQGMYKVSILSLDEAIDKEFAKQEKSQKSFEHNLDFFIDDHILYEQNLAEDKLNTIAPPKQTPNIKPGVSELFDSNPELANAVYESLGFNPNEFSLVLKKEEENPEGIMLGEYDIIYKDTVIGNVFLPLGYKNYTIKGIGFKEEFLNKGLGKAFYKWLGNKADIENATLNSDFDNTSESAERVWESLKKENLAEDVQMGFRFKPKNLKQQAQELYSQYLDSIFPDSKVKDIVYHYTDAKKFDKFIKDYIGSSVKKTGVNAADSELGIFFGKKNLEGVANKEKLGTTKIIAVVNIKNPNTDIYDKADKYLYSSDRFIDEQQEPDYDIDIEEDEYGNIKEVYKEKSKLKGKDFERAWYNSYKKDLISEEKDGVILDNIKIVFEPEQIHILGGKQDIEGFKDFVIGKNKLLQESGSLATLPQTKIDNLQNTVEYQILNEKDENLDKKVGQSYILLSEKDAKNFTYLVEKNKEFPKEFKVTKKITKYEKDSKNPLKFNGYNEYTDFYYIKSNKNKKSNLYDIVNKETGEVVASKVRVLSVSKDTKSEIAKKYGLEHTPTKVFSANRSIAFALYRQKPSKAKYIAQAKKYLYDSIKFLNPEKTNLKINLDKIEELLSSFPEEMWDYINTTYSPEDSTNINASILLQNEIKFELPKLGLLTEIEKITGIPLQGVSFRNYDRSGMIKKLGFDWKELVTIDHTLFSAKKLKKLIAYYLNSKGYFKSSSEEENVRKYAEHRGIDYNELKELVFGDIDKALDNISYNTSGNSDTIEVSKWRESIRTYDWQTAELFSKPYENFQNTVKERIQDKFKDKTLSNNISHLDYFFSGDFNWLNINFNNISGQYYLDDMETEAGVGVQTKMGGIINPFEMKIYQKPKAGENFLQEKEVFNRLAAILHEPFHALHALSYGTKEELELRKAFDNLYNTDFGKEMMHQVFGSGYNKGKQVSYDTLYKEFTAFSTQLMLYPKEWITKTDLRSNDIYDFILKVQGLQDKTYEEIIRTQQKTGTTEKTITEEEQIKLSFLEKLYNYLVKALNKIIPLSKQFTNLIVDSKLIEKQVIEDVFGTAEETVTKTLKLPENVKKSKEQFLEAMEELQSAINTLMQIDSKLFSSQNITDFFTSNKFNQESGSKQYIKGFTNDKTIKYSYQEYLQSSKESVSLEEDYFNSLPDKIKKIIIDRNKNC